jgi:hypothetical protein
MKKCSQCGAFGAAFQTTDENGEPIQLCHECRQKLIDKTENSDSDEPASKD